MQSVSVQVHKTEVLDYENYVDLLTVNGELRTHVLTKVKEPNHFELKEDLEGDQLDRVKKDWKKSS